MPPRPGDLGECGCLGIGLFYNLNLSHALEYAMSSIHSREQALESLCAKGCRQVWQAIERLQRGENLRETRCLCPEDRRWVLGELQQIMAVYAGRCAID